jgi:hypothetical protein
MTGILSLTREICKTGEIWMPLGASPGWPLKGSNIPIPMI